MEREERAAEEEVVHRVNRLILGRRQNRDHEKEEEQRDRSKKGNPGRERSWVQLLRQVHTDRRAREQSLELPDSAPAVRRHRVRGRRYAARREVDLLEIGLQIEL